MAAPPPPFAVQMIRHPPSQSSQDSQQQLFAPGFPSTERRPGAPPPLLPNTEPQGVRAPPTSPGLVTMLVRHLPEALPQDVLARLFSYYGACSVRPCAGGRLRNCAFVDFADEALAFQAQSQLNRLRFLGKVLSVERAAGKAMSDGKQQQNEVPPTKELSSQTAASLSGLSVMVKKADNLNSAPTGEPIASRLGVDYPFPPYIEYSYPPPDGNILTNIVNALIAVPQFYTQVLHLMNKMNIPAPFRMALPTPPLPSTAPPPPPPPPPISAKPHLEYLSSDESELESSEEDATDAVHRRKRVKHGAIVGPAVDSGVAHEDVGLKPASLIPKEVPMIKKKNLVLQIKIAPKPTQNESRDDDSSLRIIPEHAGDQLEPRPYVTADEIEREKLPPEELLSLPMFKNYTPGIPATVLYVKNLAKDVVADDFYFIFGSIFGNIEEAKSGLSVKLMQEGRMRGQAFVIFPSVDLAQRALNLVNGFLFKGKPMVIQFGRNPSSGKTN